MSRRRPIHKAFNDGATKSANDELAMDDETSILETRHPLRPTAKHSNGSWNISLKAHDQGQWEISKVNETSTRQTKLAMLPKAKDAFLPPWHSGIAGFTLYTLADP